MLNITYFHEHEIVKEYDLLSECCELLGNGECSGYANGECNECIVLKISSSARKNLTDIFAKFENR